MCRLTEARQVHKDALDALFMKLVVLAEGYQIAQQGFPINLFAAVMDHYATPVRLMGHRTVGFEQMGMQGFLYLFATGRRL